MLVTPAVKLLLFDIVGEAKPCLESQSFSLQSSPPAVKGQDCLSPAVLQMYLSRYSLCPSRPKQLSMARNRVHASFPKLTRKTRLAISRPTRRILKLRPSRKTYMCSLAMSTSLVSLAGSHLVRLLSQSSESAKRPDSPTWTV